MIALGFAAVILAFAILANGWPKITIINHYHVDKLPDDKVNIKN